MTDPTSLPSFPPPDDEHPLRGRVIDVLFDLKLNPNVDGEGDVSLVVREQKLFVRCVDKPMPMMRVFGQWRIGETVPDDELTRLRAANDVTARTNLVKATVHDNVLLVAVDLVVAETAPLPQLLQGAFGAVLSAVKAWHITAGGGAPGTDGGQPAEGDVAREEDDRG